MKKGLRDPPPPGSSDAIVHQALAPSTHGIALASITAAYLDWAYHVAASPDKQREMSGSAVRKLIAWCNYLYGSGGGCPPCARPQPDDKRFADSGWSTIPFSGALQAFLLTEQWWGEAMSDVPGVSDHHEDVAKFVTRQWLDMLSPSNFVFSNPEILRYTIATGGSNLIRGVINWYQDATNLLLERRPRGTDAFVPGRDVAVTPGKVIYRNRLIELIQYKSDTGATYPEPVLIVPAWIMKYYVLDLSPQNSMVRYLIEHGHTVLMISWNNPTRGDRDLSFGDYLEMGIMSALQTISKMVPDTPIHAVGYCLGGTLLAIAAAALRRRQSNILASMTLLASQLDFEEPGQLGLFIDESQVAYLETIMSSQGYLDGRQMAGAFALINSKDLVWSKLVHEYLMGAQTPMTDLRAWNADATRMPYRMHSEYLRKLYLNNELAEGRFEVDGKPIALKDLRLPIFVVGTERDHVSPWTSVYKIHWLTECEITFVLSSGGHNVGIVNPPLGNGYRRSSYRIAHRDPGGEYVDPDAWLAASRKQKGSWWPEWEAWLAKRSSKKTAAMPISGNLALSLAELEDAPGSYVHVT